LIQISNSKLFGKQLYINNISPNVVADFTNSLLSDSHCKWLLIFDNVTDNKDIKLPNIRIAGQHIIVTTREKRYLGDNVLTLRPFTNQESEIFLSKVHPKEKKENIIKLSKVLRNYPLALAQVSKEILMYNGGIDSYFEKRNNNSGIELSMVNSDITQNYNYNYHEVLNMTLQDIERKDKEAAKILYMLALLPTDLTKEFLMDLFGSMIEEKLITLGRYGVIQAMEHNNAQIFNIHDVIRDETLNKFNSKDELYKKDVILYLIKNFNNLYSDKDFQYFIQPNLSNNYITTLYKIIDICLEKDIISEETIHAINIALRLNSRSVCKYVNPDLHRQLSSKIYHKNLENISPIKRSLLYTSLLYSEFIFESEERFLEYKKECLRLLNLIEKSKNYKDLFSIHTCLSYLYLFIGDFQEAKKYVDKAQENINYSNDSYNLYEHLYIKAWVSYELREIDSGMRTLAEIEELSISKSLSQIAKLFIKDFKIKFLLLKGKKEEAKKEIEEALKIANSYYNNTPSSTIGELEYTKTMVYFESGQYDLAEKQGRRALNILTKAFGGDVVDLTQAHIYIMLGKIHEEKGNRSAALEKYKKALNFYDKKSDGKSNNFYEYGELLSNLSTFYYKQKNYIESKFYFQKLAQTFGLEHKIVAKLIKTLPHEYIYRISDKNKA